MWLLSDLLVILVPVLPVNLPVTIDALGKISLMVCVCVCAPKDLLFVASKQAHFQLPSATLQASVTQTLSIWSSYLTAKIAQPCMRVFICTGTEVLFHKFRPPPTVIYRFRFSYLPFGPKLTFCNSSNFILFWSLQGSLSITASQMFYYSCISMKKLGILINISIWVMVL